MVFQYQYQYQYQLQRGLGLTTYDSFSRLLHDTYSNPVLLSLLVAVLPLLYFFFRERIVKTRFYYTLYSIYKKRREEKRLKIARIIFEETFLGKKRIDFSTLFLVFFTIVIGGLIFSKSLFFVAVTSNSMAPTFWETDLVLMQSISKDYREGDIIVFQSPQVFYDLNVIHRISSFEPEKVKTKGDNIQFPDDWILSEEDIIGSAVTYNGHPVVAKKVGKYFIKDYEFNKNALVGFSTTDLKLLSSIRGVLTNIHTYGPLYLIIIILLILLSQLEQPDKSKVY